MANGEAVADYANACNLPLYAGPKDYFISTIIFIRNPRAKLGH